MGKLIDTINRFQWVITVFIFIVLALGFNFKTPAQALQDVKQSIELNEKETKDSLLALKAEDVKLRTEVSQLRTLLEMVAVTQCQTLPDRVIRNSRLPCRRLYREWGIE